MEGLVEWYWIVILVVVVIWLRGSDGNISSRKNRGVEDVAESDYGNDRTRDRDLAKLGYQTYRFSGKQINQDADQCARDVMEIVKANQSK